MAQENHAPTLRELYPHLSDAELLEASANLDRYILLVLGIFKRLGEINPQADQLTAVDGTLGCTPPESGLPI